MQKTKEQKISMCRNKYICFRFDNVMRPACDICKSAVHILRNAFLVSDTPATFGI